MSEIMGLRIQSLGKYVPQTYALIRYMTLTLGRQHADSIHRLQTRHTLRSHM
jgi:hypothetical protein